MKIFALIAGIMGVLIVGPGPIINSYRFDTEEDPGCAATVCDTLEFDGVNEFVTAVDNSNLTFGNGTTDQPFSVTMRIHPESLTSKWIVAKGGNTTTNAEWAVHTDAFPRIYLVLSSNGNYNNRIVAYISVGAYLNQSRWLTFTYNGSGNASGIDIYVDGSKQVATTATAGTYVAMNNTVHQLLVGARLNGGNYYDGFMDKVAVFRNIDLSDAQVAELLTADNLLLHSKADSMVLYWEYDCDGPGPDNITDLSSGGNDGSTQNIEIADFKHCEAQPPANDNFVKVMAWGQSNMAGDYGAGADGDTTSNDSVFVWNRAAQAWKVARFGKYPFRSGYNNPAHHFCKRLAQETGKQVRMIYHYEGATSLENWVPNSANWDTLQTAFYESDMRKIDIIMQHQGESDDDAFSTAYNTDATYAAGLIDMIDACRANFGDTAIYVAGQLLIGGANSARSDTICNLVYDNYNCARSYGFTGADTKHFTGPELVTFGFSRYWNARDSIP